MINRNYSPLVITKSGFLPSIAKTYKYKAFGETKYESGSYDNNHKFTGKELDETGLYYFGARYNDKSLGRFLSTDPVLNIGDDPQNLNPYIYCKNNPLRFVDPSGLEPHEVTTEEIMKKSENSDNVIVALVGIIAEKDVTISGEVLRTALDELGVPKGDLPFESIETITKEGNNISMTVKEMFTYEYVTKEKEGEEGTIMSIFSEGKNPIKAKIEKSKEGSIKLSHFKGIQTKANGRGFTLSYTKIHKENGKWMITSHGGSRVLGKELPGTGRTVTKVIKPIGKKKREEK